MYLIEDINSSLIREIEYWEDQEELIIYFQPNYFTDHITYCKVPMNYFMEFSEAKSFGKFYLELIKPNFLTKSQTQMANKPKGINEASDKQRIIKLNINVSKIDKSYLFVGENGNVYMNCTLLMKPNGKVDHYGNLGMIVQDVPKEIYDKDKTIKGEILGNGAEYSWNPAGVRPGEETGERLPAASADDLPF